MNRLDPDLKRLMKWARHAFTPKPDQAPWGFSSRVMAALKSESTPPALPILERLLAVSAWVSAVVIAGGAIFLASQTRQPESAFNFTSAYQFFAKHIAP